MERSSVPGASSPVAGASSHGAARPSRLPRLIPLDAENSWQWAFLLAAAAAAIVLIPFFLFGQASGHDLDFHLTSWMEVARQWRQGIPFPRWAAGANYGYGEPRFIFYPPMSWLLGAALGSLLPWDWAPGAFIFLCLVTAGLSMHRLASTWMTPRGALAAALIYALNPYQMANVYLRSDFAELLAAALFPLAVHFVLRETRGSRAWRNSMWLAVVYGAIWLSNAPAGVVTSYALAVLIVFRAASKRSLKPIVFGGAGLAVGFALAGIYVIPASLEQPWVNIAQVISPGLSIAENYLFTWTLDPEHNLFNLQVSAIAALMLASTGIAAVLSYRRRSRGWVALCALGLVSAVMLFPPSHLAWRYLPELRFVQFPWRWLFPLATSMAFLFGEFFSAVPSRSAARPSLWRAQSALALLLLALGAGTGAWIASIAFWNSDEVSDDLASVDGAQGYEGTDEYCPIDADNTNLNRSAPMVAVMPTTSSPDDPHSEPGDKQAGTMPHDAGVAVETWGPERKIFAVDSPEPASAALRLLNYPAWQVLVNGQPARAQSADSTGQMLVPLAGGRNRVEVRFGRTADRTLGAASSIFGCVLLALMWFLSNPNEGGLRPPWRPVDRPSMGH